jgi:hypothetical protein
MSWNSYFYFFFQLYKAQVVNLTQTLTQNNKMLPDPDENQHTESKLALCWDPTNILH